MDLVKPNDSSEVEIKDPNDKVCAPGKVFENGSCFTLNSLITMADAYNKDNPTNKIKLNKTYETLHPHKYKKYLVKEFQKKLQKECKSQQCWTMQSFMRHISTIIQDEINDFTFRPSGPEGKFEWLNTMHIDDVMKQYEKKYPEFKFIGTVPIDFDDLPVLGIKDLNFGDLIKEGKTKIGFVFNLDEHWKSGSHWVALYANLKDGEIYFGDSYGTRPDKRIRHLMNRINRFCRSELGIKTTDVNYNKVRQQFKNSECGVYSINFIVRLLKGTTLDEIMKNPVSDDRINKCRSVYFTKK